MEVVIFQCVAIHGISLGSMRVSPTEGETVRRVQTSKNKNGRLPRDEIFATIEDDYEKWPERKFFDDYVNGFKLNL